VSKDFLKWTTKAEEQMKGAPVFESILHFLLIALFLVLPCLASAEEPKPPTPGPAYGAMGSEAGEIIVKFKEGIPRASIRSVLLAEGVEILDEMDNLGLILLSVPKGRELEKIGALERNPLVEYAEPNYIQVANTAAVEPYYGLHAPAVEPNDPYYPSQWSLPKIEAPAAWEITTGSNKVVIAFIDSGVDFNHNELKDKIWTNRDELPDNGIDDDGNGYVDDVHGWDFAYWDGEPQDGYWHGTFISSIAAAMTNNGDGMAGVSWGAEIMPVKTMDDYWYVKPWHIMGGIEYAVDNGAKIINLSWQLVGSEYPQALQTAVDYAYSKGALVIAAAGNTFDSTYKYPAALNHVVSVAATDRDDSHPDFSTYNDRVDIAAPGVDILGIANPLGFEYGRLPSTDAAAPHVSALAALVWSVNPTLTNDEVEDIIESTAVDLGEPGRDDYFGHGRIDASAAVMATPHYLDVEPDDGLYFLVCDDSIPPSQKITNPNTNSSTWTATATVSWLSISPPEGYTPSSATVSIDIGGLPGYGTHTTVITASSTMTNSVNNPEVITTTVNYPSQCWRVYLPYIIQDP